MYLKRLTLVILGLFLLAGAVAATDLSPSIISSGNTGWLVANGIGQTTITVQANSPSGPLQGASVTFWVTDPTMGTISPASPTGVSTGPDGIATAVYTVGTKSGTAVIDALISYPNGDGTYSTLTLSYSQNIDHDVAKFAQFTYLSRLPAGRLLRSMSCLRTTGVTVSTP